MTYNVFSGTLNPTHFTSLSHRISCRHPHSDSIFGNCCTFVPVNTMQFLCFHVSKSSWFILLSHQAEWFQFLNSAFSFFFVEIELTWWCSYQSYVPFPCAAFHWPSVAVTSEIDNSSFCDTYTYHFSFNWNPFLISVDKCLLNVFWALLTCHVFMCF